MLINAIAEANANEMSYQAVKDCVPTDKVDGLLLGSLKNDHIVVIDLDHFTRK